MRGRASAPNNRTTSHRLIMHNRTPSSLGIGKRSGVAAQLEATAHARSRTTALIFVTTAITGIATSSGLAGCKDQTPRPKTDETKTQALAAAPSTSARIQAVPSNPPPPGPPPATTPASSFELDPHPATAAACAPDEQVLFSCRTKGAGKSIALCASKHLSKSDGYIQYRFGRGGTVELEFPGRREKTQQEFRYSHYSRFQVDRVGVSFSRAGFTYSIFENYEGDMGPAAKQYGIEVTGTGNSAKATSIECEGKVVSKLSALQDVVPCDKSDPTNTCP